MAELVSQDLLLYSASRIHSVSGLFSFWSLALTDPSGRAPPPHLPLLGILLPTLLPVLVSCLPRLPLMGWTNGDNFANNPLYPPTEAREQSRQSVCAQWPTEILTMQKSLFLDLNPSPMVGGAKE